MNINNDPVHKANISSKNESEIFYILQHHFLSFYSQQRGFKAPEFSLRIFKTMYFFNKHIWAQYTEVYFVCVKRKDNDNWNQLSSDLSEVSASFLFHCM